ncbi:MAG TPA: DUF2892 domain-containing protein [Anaerolineales bacterium]
MSYVNESALDRIIRVILGLAGLYAGWSGTVSGPVGIVLLVIGGILLATGLIGFCPLYAVFKYRTNKA